VVLLNVFNEIKKAGIDRVDETLFKEVDIARIEIGITASEYLILELSLPISP